MTLYNASKGSVRVFADMDRVKEILLREGFADPTPLQVQKEGQVFGLIKRISNDLEMHVRGYDDFTFESEIELSREYLEHPYDCRPFYGPLLEILHHYRIPFTIMHPLPKDPQLVRVPTNKTPWKPILIVGSCLLAGLGLIWLTSKLDEKEEG